MASTFQTVNPANGEVIKSFTHLEWLQAEKLIQEAHQDFQKWSHTSFDERSGFLIKLAEKLRAHKTEIAESMKQEMGKLLAEGKAEVEKCAITCEFYAKEGAQMLQPQVSESPYKSAEVHFQPLGVIFSIMPWNFPLWQVIRFAAPSIMAGNVILLKHADLTAGTSEWIAKIFQEVSGSPLLLRNCQVDHTVAEKIMASPLIQGVTFTGSTRGGKEVAKTAAGNLKKTVLELGGSDAYVVFADADIEKAAKTCVQARLVNCGQSCVAAKRFIVVEKVAQEFTQAYIAEMKKAELAPLANEKFKKQIIEQVEKLKKWGGKVLLGGTAPQGPGAFYPATVVMFEKNNPDMHAEEIFGPVASIIVVKNEVEAIEVANSSPYGLGGALFTRDVEKGKFILAKEMQAGFVVLNDQVKSDPRIPFGGVKDSGYGRELGWFGIHEFVNVKTVAIGGI